MVFMILIGRDCREEDHRVEPKIKSLEIFAIKKILGQIKRILKISIVVWALLYFRKLRILLNLN